MKFIKGQKCIFYMHKIGPTAKVKNWTCKAFYIHSLCNLFYCIAPLSNKGTACTGRDPVKNHRTVWVGKDL